MIRAAGLAGLLLLAACHRQAELTPDADAETRNATAAKTLADIAAAEDASRSPLPPAPRPRPIISEAATPPDRERDVPDDTGAADEPLPSSQ